MPFLNEGTEPIKTIESLYETASKDLFEIIAIDDGSTIQIEFPNCYKEIKHIRNKIRQGSQVCKDFGVQMSNTPFIMLIDAHMRFKTKNWLSRMIDVVSVEPNSIYCTSSSNYSDSNFQKKVFGASLVLYDEKKPVYKRILETKAIKTPQFTNDIYSIECLLGANYITSKEFYMKICGLHGLLYWGTSEPYLSIKTFLFGGHCKMIPNIEIAHLYRKKADYLTPTYYMLYNKLFILETLFSTKLRNKYMSLLPNSHEVLAAKLLVKKNKKQIEAFKKYVEMNATLSIYDYFGLFHPNIKL